MKIYMIRHGKTAGNLKGRYIGKTDEPLCEEGRAELARGCYVLQEHSAGEAADRRNGGDAAVSAGQKKDGDAAVSVGQKKDGDAAAPEALYVSPLLRCRQTAELLFPGIVQSIVPDFRECDFGSFENKNYRELSGDAAYQAWIDSGGTLPFPGGESRDEFPERCVRAFRGMLAEAEKNGCREIACVVHGGTIMSVLSALASVRRGYFDYQVKNGCGYLVEWKEGEQAGDVTVAGRIDCRDAACREKE